MQEVIGSNPIFSTYAVSAIGDGVSRFRDNLRDKKIGSGFCRSRFLNILFKKPVYSKVSVRSTTVSWLVIVNSFSTFSPLLTTEIL